MDAIDQLREEKLWVLRALEAATETFRSARRAPLDERPDPALTALLVDLRALLVQVHHPREELAVFPWLRRRVEGAQAAEVGPALARLEGEHQTTVTLLDDLLSALRASPPRIHQAAARLETLGELVRQHMAIETGPLLEVLEQLGDPEGELEAALAATARRRDELLSDLRRRLDGSACDAPDACPHSLHAPLTAA